jgi:hypothetical protein
MSLKLKEQVGINLAFDSLMNDDLDVAFELFLFASNIKKQMYGVFDIFLLFIRKYKKRKTHKMFLLMLDPRYKNLC